MLPAPEVSEDPREAKPPPVCRSRARHPELPLLDHSREGRRPWIKPPCGAVGGCTSIPEGLSLPTSRAKTLSANITDSLLCTRKTIQFLPLRP